MLGLDLFEMSVDKELESTVLPAESEAEESFEMQEAAHNFLPLLIVERIGETALILGFVELSLWIIEDHLSCRSACQDFCSPVRGGHPPQSAVGVPGEAEHDHGPSHESLAEVFEGGSYEVHPEGLSPRITDGADPCPVDHVSEDVKCSTFCRISCDLAHIAMDIQPSRMHDHSGEVLGMAMDTD